MNIESQYSLVSNDRGKKKKEIVKKFMDFISPPPFLGTLPKWISCALNHSNSHFMCDCVLVCGPVRFSVVYIVCVPLCIQLL